MFHQSLPSLLLLVLLLLLLSQTQSRNEDRHIIKFNSPGLYPNSLVYDPSSQHFIVTSLNHPSFHSVSDASVFETLTLNPNPNNPNPNPLENSTIHGIAIDTRHNRLLAAVNTAASPYIAAFSLHRNSLSLLFLSPLPTTAATSAVANAVTVDPHGDAYVTNSADDVIWKTTINGTSSILTTPSQFNRKTRIKPSKPGLNGVVYVAGKEYILVIQKTTGKLFKIDVVDGTTRSVILPLSLTEPEGITVKDNGDIIISSKKTIWVLNSDDSWGEGRVKDEITLEKKGGVKSVSLGGGGRVYVLYGEVEEGKMGINIIEEIKGKGEGESENGWVYVMVGLGLVYFMFWRFQMGQLVKNMDKKRS